MNARRRGETLVEVTAALVIFAIALLAFGKQWASVNQQRTLIREQQTIARIDEQSIEEARSAGPVNLPNMPPGGSPWQVRYYDGLGRAAAAQAPGGYVAQTWVAYVPNPAAFQDGTAGVADGTSLREVTVRVYRAGAAAPCMQSSTYVAPLSPQ